MRRCVEQPSEKKAQTSLSMFVEIKGLEVEHEGALVTTFFGVSELLGQWAQITEDMCGEKSSRPWQLVVEGGWVQTRLYDIGWADELKCRGCNKE